MEQYPNSHPGKSSRQLSAWCEAWIKDGRTQEDIMNALLRECALAEAMHIYNEAKGSLIGRAQLLLGSGVVIFLLGAVITYATYSSAASAGSGQYLVCIGAIVCGPICAIIGLRSLLRLKKG